MIDQLVIKSLQDWIQHTSSSYDLPVSVEDLIEFVTILLEQEEITTDFKTFFTTHLGDIFLNDSASYIDVLSDKLQELVQSQTTNDVESATLLTHLSSSSEGGSSSPQHEAKQPDTIPPTQSTQTTSLPVSLIPVVPAPKTGSASGTHPSNSINTPNIPTNASASVAKVAKIIPKQKPTSTTTVGHDVGSLATGPSTSTTSSRRKVSVVKRSESPAHDDTNQITSTRGRDRNYSTSVTSSSSLRDSSELISGSSGGASNAAVVKRIVNSTLGNRTNPQQKIIPKYQQGVTGVPPPPPPPHTSIPLTSGMPPPPPPPVSSSVGLIPVNTPHHVHSSVLSSSAQPFVPHNSSVQSGPPPPPPPPPSHYQHHHPSHDYTSPQHPPAPPPHTYIPPPSTSPTTGSTGESFTVYFDKLPSDVSIHNLRTFLYPFENLVSVHEVTPTSAIAHFSDYNSANAVVTTKDAICGNRFIRVSWYNKDHHQKRRHNQHHQQKHQQQRLHGSTDADHDHIAGQDGSNVMDFMHPAIMMNRNPAAMGHAQTMGIHMPFPHDQTMHLHGHQQSTTPARVTQAEYDAAQLSLNNTKTLRTTMVDLQKKLLQQAIEFKQQHKDDEFNNTKKQIDNCKKRLSDLDGQISTLQKRIDDMSKSLSNQNK